MIRRLFVLVVFALIFGCTQEVAIRGISEKDMQVGTEINKTLKLLSKDECLFGEIDQFFNLDDKSDCDKLETDGSMSYQYYHIEGEIIGYRNYSTAEVLGTDIETEDGKRIVLSSPTIRTSKISLADRIFEVVDVIKWTRKVDIPVPLNCSFEMINKSVVFEKINGTVSDEILVAGRTDSNEMFNITEIGFGIGEKEDDYFFFLKTDSPWYLFLSAWDSFVTINGKNYYCDHVFVGVGKLGSLYEDNVDYLVCRVFDRIGEDETESTLLSFYRNNIECTGVSDLNKSSN